MRAIFESLPGLMGELRNDEAREAIVFAIWRLVLGRQLRERSAPLNLAGDVLTVAVTDNEWKRELTQHAPEIVYKLNRTFGMSLIKRIDLLVDAKAVTRGIDLKTHGSQAEWEPLSASSDLQQASNAIADTELRKHFLEAAAACIAHRDGR